MNYKIILDKNELTRFIDWLPDLRKGETYYCCLFARSKYSTEGFKIKSGQTQLKRFTSDKKYLFSKIKQLECEVGSYLIEDKPCPQEALALYINPNPRDMEKATKNSLIKFAHLVTKPYDGYNPHSEVMSEIQNAHSRKVFIDFDFDNVEPQTILKEIKEKDILNLHAITIVKTRGGFHLLVKTDEINFKYTKSWYQTISNLPGVDIKGDGLLPCVGCHQGGFTPNILNITN